MTSTANTFNSVGGFSVGIPPVPVVDGNANVVTNVNTTGNVTANVVYATYYKLANGAPFIGTAGGTNTQLQFNSGGTFGGIPNVTWNGNILSLGSVSNISIGGGTNGYVLQTDGAGNLSWTAQTGNGGGNATPGGANTQVQYNNAGNFAGSSGFTFDSTTNLLTAPHISGEGGNLSNIAGSNVTGTVANAAYAVTANYAAYAGNVTGNVENANYAAYAGNVTNNAQPNITSVGTLTGLTVGNATSNVTFGNGTVDATGNIIASNFIGNGTPMTFNTSAKILYVATNGDDANNGDINKPYRTIKTALNAASAGGFSVHVAPGTYTEANPITIPSNVALMGDNLRNVTVIPQTPSADLFYVRSGCYVWGITIRNYTANGFSFDPATPTQNVFVSPYIQNLTSSTTTGTAVYIDGANVSSISTKAMIVGFFTIINRGGKGIHILNTGYSQLVNIYTIACDIGIKVESGAFCTLNGSDCSIGNYGLVADGYGPLQTTGTIVSEYQGIFVLNNLSNGQPHVNTIMVIQDDPEYYTIDTIAPNQPIAGQSTVVIQQVYNTETPVVGKNVSFYVRSSIIASAHTFEYVGAGTNPATALPQYGGIPIEANEVIATNGGVITFTSTDQKGNFKVGLGFTINQATGVITGDYFYQSLFAQMTPFILALGGL